MMPGFLLALVEIKILKDLGCHLWDLGGVNSCPLMRWGVGSVLWGFVSVVGCVLFCSVVCFICYVLCHMNLIVLLNIPDTGCAVASTPICVSSTTTPCCKVSWSALGTAFTSTTNRVIGTICSSTRCWTLSGPVEEEEEGWNRPVLSVEIMLFCLR